MTHQIRQHVVVALQGPVERIKIGVGEKTFLDLPETEAVFDGGTGSADFLRTVPDQQDTSVSEPVQHQSRRENDDNNAGNHWE